MADKPTQVNIPDIEVNRAAWPAHLTGDVETDPAEGPAETEAPAPPQRGRFVISVGDLRTAESSLLGGIKRVVAEYDSLAGYVGNTKDWIFRKEDPDKPIPPKFLAPGRTPAHFPVGSPAEKGATETEYALEMEAAQTRLLLAVSDAIAMVGNYVELLAKAGNFYVRGDKESYLPG